MKRRTCPVCGAPLDWRELLQQKRDADPAWRQWTEHRYRLMGFGAEQAVAAGADYERKRPIRDASLESDVAVPGLQALITGAVSGLAGGTLAAVLGWNKPGWIALGLLGGSTALTWLALLRSHRDLLWENERIIGTDLDRDGAVGDPRRVDVEPKPRITRVEVTERRGANLRARYIDVPLSDHELERVAHTVLIAKENLSRRGLSDILTQSQYASFYGAMQDGGLLIDTGNGNELTGAGRAFLRQYIG